MCSKLIKNEGLQTYIDDLKLVYDIKFCGIDEVEEVIGFIDNYWKKNHIFVLSKELFDWQHFNKDQNNYNFVIARHKDSNEIHAILGFIPTTQFDNKIKDIKIWPCICKIRKDKSIPGLGMVLYYFMEDELNPEVIAISAISKISLKIYKYWEFMTGKMDSYYILNDGIKDFRLIKLKIENVKKEYSTDSNKSIIEIMPEDYKEFAEKLDIPRYKSINYYVNRFYNHPIYKYQSYGVFVNEECKSIIFMRKCDNNSASALRIVDFLGDESSLIGLKKEFLNILHQQNAEYVDFVCSNWDKDILEQAGFVLKNDDEIIVPNYFEPFELRNIELDYAYKTKCLELKPKFVKADSDQDRPSII